MKPQTGRGRNSTPVNALLVALLVGLAIPGGEPSAKVYKCVSSTGAHTYQSKPCDGATHQQQVDIRTSASSTRGLTEASFDEIKPSTTIDDLVRLIGWEGRKDVLSSQVTAWIWENDSHSISVQVSAGKVLYKGWMYKVGGRWATRNVQWDEAGEPEEWIDKY